jgi:THO complex subunit 1
MPCFQVYLGCLMKGRILCLLSTCYPVSERSAVNQKGDFNVGNVTVYQEMAIGDDMDVDGQEDDKGKDF